MGEGASATPGKREREDRRLEAAVALGIISAEQAQAIRDIAPLRSDAGPSGAVTAATLGYVLGAITVVVAMGWFLADRWTWLGPGGALAVAVLYAVVFAAVAVRLRRDGYPTAGGFAATLTVAMAPVATTALLQLGGWPPRLAGLACGGPDFLLLPCRGEEIVVELATALAALTALRQIRFTLLLAPLVAIALRLLFHAAAAFARGGLSDASLGWVWAFGAGALTVAAYATDRHQRGDEDFALWLHLGAVIAAVPATLHLQFAYEWYRHLMIPGAFVAFAMALSLRRFVWALLGMFWFVWYLGWLAADVFRETPAFPIVLAALGVAVIVATVWVQRNAARLVQRFGVVSDDGRARFPGGVPLLVLPALVALLMLPDGVARDRERRAEAQWRETHRRARARHEAVARRARGESLPLTAGREAPPEETRVAPRP